MAALSFGINLRGSSSADGFRDVVRRAEDLGCDVIAAPDHLGTPDPFAVLTAAAQVTRRMRLWTYVLDTPFVLLARDRSHPAEILAQRREEFALTPS